MCTACCHPSVNPASVFAACRFKLSTYLLFAFKYSPPSRYSHLIVSLFLCYQMKSYPRLRAHKLYVSNNVSAEKWRKKRRILPECESLKWCTLIIDVPCLFSHGHHLCHHTLLLHLSFFIIIFIPHPLFFNAGDEVVWQNVPQQQKK